MVSSPPPDGNKVKLKNAVMRSDKGSVVATAIIFTMADKSTLRVPVEPDEEIEIPDGARVWRAEFPPQEEET